MPNKTAARPAPGIISFFAGCGILDLGFETTGFRVWLANEIFAPFASAYEHSRMRMDIPPPVDGPVVRAPIEAFLDGREQGRLEAAMAGARAAAGAVGFIGGPPCPDFSIAGKQAGRTGDCGRLSQDYCDLIGIMRPDFFLFENVKGLKSTAKHRAFFEEMLARFRDDGYAVTERTVSAVEYGAPQDRQRVIVVGFHRQAFPDADAMAEGFAWNSRVTHPGALASDAWPSAEILDRDPATGAAAHTVRPAPPAMTENLKELTVGRWFERNGVGTHPNAGDVFQVKAGLGRMRAAREGDTSNKSFKRLHRWRYSPTVAYGNNEVHLHPWLDRRLSVAEAMALQSLPREFELPPGMTLSDKFKTIGNAVPLKLAAALAATVADAIGDRVATPFERDADRVRTPLPAVPVPPEHLPEPEDARELPIAAEMPDLLAA
jgi:DNA (cytosine-5)-methyltransferase 1